MTLSQELGILDQIILRREEDYMDKFSHPEIIYLTDLEGPLEYRVSQRFMSIIYDNYSSYEVADRLMYFFDLTKTNPELEKYILYTIVETEDHTAATIERNWVLKHSYTTFEEAKRSYNDRKLIKK